MRRWIAFLLSLTLCGSLGLHALAEPETADGGTAPESADVRLARVTDLVKETLDLHTERYTEFHGDVSEEPLGNVWYLSWSGEQGSMSVNALEDGTVVNYWYNDNQESVYNDTRLPVFPKRDAEKLKAAAQAFLNRVLDPAAESVELADPETGSLRGTATRFSGTILLNGLPSPLTWSINVRNTDNVVTSFRRDAPSQSFLGNIPSPIPAVSPEDAAAALQTTLNLELIYVETDTNQAALRYVPKEERSAAVDAQTGELVDLTDNGIRAYNTAAAEAEEASMDMGTAAKGRALTEVEQVGVEKLEGVLDRDALDRAVRAEKAYKLDGYTLSYSRYSLIKEADADGKPEGKETVVCSLRYTLPSEDDSLDVTWEGLRVFEVDARTGAVRSLYSNSRWDREKKPAVTLSAARQTASAFLGRYTKNAMALYNTDDRTEDGAQSYTFTFARQHSGYFFPADCCHVTVDAQTGAVSGLEYHWHEKLSFASADGLVSPESALSAWLGTYETTLGYVRLSKKLDSSAAGEARLIDAGYTSFYSLFLGYTLTRGQDSPYLYCPGIDAKTGEPVARDTSDSTEIAYSDTADAAPEIETLAAYGIGYTGGKFHPARTVTQWDMVCLLASSQGWRLNPDETEDSQRDNVYNAVYYMGALERSERNDNAALTRADAVKLLLNCAGYGSAAKLRGIFTVGYQDGASIPEADMGYAAIAQALGLVPGTTYRGTETLTREAAAVLLFRAMSREG